MKEFIQLKFFTIQFLKVSSSWMIFWKIFYNSSQWCVREAPNLLPTLIVNHYFSYTLFLSLIVAQKKYRLSYKSFELLIGL